jgi:hypothetical protein
MRDQIFLFDLNCKRVPNIPLYDILVFQEIPGIVSKEDIESAATTYARPSAAAGHLTRHVAVRL